jgi:hypothetical protein
MRIFIIWRDGTLNFQPTSAFVRTPSWLSITWVCSSWREIALSHALFWNRIEITAKDRVPGFMEELIRRSCQVPLRLSIRSLDTESGTPLLVSRQFYRLKELEVHPAVIYDANPPEGLRCLTQPAPILTHLVLNARDPNHDTSLLRRAPRLTSNLFGHSLPLLQEAEIRHLPIAPFSPFLKSVARLSLHTYGTVRQIVETLSSLSNLRELDIEIESRYSRRQLPIPALTPLRKISRVVVRGEAEICIEFFNAVSLPSLCSFQCDMTDISMMHEDEEIHSRLQAGLQQQWSIISDQARPLLHLRIVESPRHLAAYHDQGLSVGEQAFLVSLPPKSESSEADGYFGCVLIGACLPVGPHASMLQSLEIGGFGDEMLPFLGDFSDSFFRWTVFSKACTSVQQLRLYRVDERFVSVIFDIYDEAVPFPAVVELHEDLYTWSRCRRVTGSWLRIRVLTEPLPLKLVVANEGQPTILLVDSSDVDALVSLPQ